MANPRLQISDLDFDQIKENLKSYLQQQTTFQDYDFEGSGLSILLDILAYNTHYNSYYLNMVANEAFLDTAILRDSVVSHAKTLGYTPYSITAPKAVINVTLESGNTTPGIITMGRGFSFSSSVFDFASYNFVLLEEAVATKSGTAFFFENLEIYEGSLNNYEFTYNKNSNPKSTFTLPDSNIDTNTIAVSVTPNSGNTFSEVYNLATSIIDVQIDSPVFFIQEDRNGTYKIYFSDGTIGKALDDGAVVSVSYLVTRGTVANQLDAFVPNTTPGGIPNVTVEVVNVAAGGTDRESIDEIKFSAVSQFTTQNRLVTFKDYESYIKTNYPNIDSLSVWGGEEENPPEYGKVYISLKPKLNYYISEIEKQRIIDEIISPKSIVSVTPQIRDPKFLYLLLFNNVKYTKSKTNSSITFIKNAIKNSILGYSNTNLNKFGSIFVLSKLQDSIDNVDLNSIVGSETIVRIQKRFEPVLNQQTSYTIDFNVPLHRGTITNRMTSTQFDVYDVFGIRRSVILEEIPQSFTGVSSIEITNGGSGYLIAPTVTITGDGTGATAESVIINGRVTGITITNRGSGYTRALATISGGSGYGATAVAVLDAKFGTIRTIYYDEFVQRQTVKENVGTINYDTGIITINDILILSVNSSDGLIRLTIESESGILSSSKDTIITIDETDPASITTELSEA
jgi:hypothetical protein